MKRITKFANLLLLAALPWGARASQQPAAAKPETWWTGTLTSVNTQDKKVTGKQWPSTETFYIGEQCAISTVDKKVASLSDLRPGEKVRIRFEYAEGIRVADLITERPLRYEGVVHSVDAKAGTITMAEAPLYQPFRAPECFYLAGDCKVVLSNGQDGTLADLRTGDRVSVAYELPDRVKVAYRIQERTTTFQGVASAIDLPAGSLRAKEGSTEKQFTFGDHCQVVLPDDRTGHLKDLQPGQEYLFTYENLNGINVLDRIAPVQPEKAPETALVR